MLYQTMETLKQRARDSGLFAVVDSDLDYNNPVVKVSVDRAKAASLGIGMRDIGDSLAVLVGEQYINRFALYGRSYDVITQSTEEQRLTPQALARQYVRTEGGQELIPLSALVHLDITVAPNRLLQFDQQNASTLQAIPAPGVSQGRRWKYCWSNWPANCRRGSVMTGSPSHANTCRRAVRWYGRFSPRWW